MSKHKRRSIVVEGETYQWLVGRDAVHVWHRTLGHQSFARDRHEVEWDDTDPITPRDVAEFIYREYLHRAPPARKVHRVRIKIGAPRLVPTLNVNQQRVFVLVREFFWFREDDGVLVIEEQAIAGFTDPAMAKEQANRLNPDYAALVREWQAVGPAFIGDFRTALREHVTDIDRLIESGFALWKSTEMPLYDCVTSR